MFCLFLFKLGSYSVHITKTSLGYVTQEFITTCVLATTTCSSTVLKNVFASEILLLIG